MLRSAPSRRSCFALLPLLAAPAVLRASPCRLRQGHGASSDSVLQPAAMACDRGLGRVTAGRLGFDGLARLRRHGMTLVEDVDPGAMRLVADEAHAPLAKDSAAEALARLRRIAAA